MVLRVLAFLAAFVDATFPEVGLRVVADLEERLVTDAFPAAGRRPLIPFTKAAWSFSVWSAYSKANLARNSGPASLPPI